MLVKGTAAPLIYVSPLQIIFQMPYETAEGTSSVVVINNNAASAAAPVTVHQAAPFILTYGSANNRAVAVIHSFGRTLERPLPRRARGR